MKEIKNSLLRRLIYNRKFLITVLVPILLIPVLFIRDDDVIEVQSNCETEKRPSTKVECSYVILLMAIYWVTEAIPLAITSLLPLVLLPLFGIQDTCVVAEAYMKESTMMFIGGLIIAMAMECSNLHKRIALRVMSIIGGSPTRLLLGIMLTTMFLSMWMANSATTSMMLPIVIAVLDELSQTEKFKIGRLNSSTIHSPRRGSEIEDNLLENPGLYQRKMYLLGVAYSSNIGGTGTLTGIPTNVAFLELMKPVDVSQGGKYLDINFTTWMALNVPIMLVNITVAYFYLTIVYFGLPNWLRFGRSRKSDEELPKENATSSSVSKMLKEQYCALGRMSFHELAVSILFVLIVLLWFTREPGFFPGWGAQLQGVEVANSTAAMLVVFLLFLVPRDLNVLFGDLPVKNPGALLEWKLVQSNLPWGAVLLLGGGVAISDAANVSGLSVWIGEQMNGLQSLPPWLILLFVMTMTALITEVLSNMATLNLLVPILISLSKTLDFHPLYLTLATAVCSSYAFMFPSATASNAIIFSAGGLTIMDMVKNGLFLNVSCVLIFFVLNITYGNLLFGYGNYVYAESNNMTMRQEILVS